MDEYIGIKKSDLFDYIFYNEQGKLVAKLNVVKIKELLEVDELIFKETEHR